MRNMMVTGGCGFIGSNFIHYILKESGFTGRVINVDKLTYAGNPENLSDISALFPDQYLSNHLNFRALSPSLRAIMNSCEP